MAVSPTGESAYVTNRQDDNISQYNVGKDGGLSPKSPAAVATDDDPWSVALRPPPTSREQCKHDGWREFGFESKRECRHFVKRRARHICRAEREEIGRPAFREKYGKGKHHRRAVRRCVTRTVEA